MISTMTSFGPISYKKKQNPVAEQNYFTTENSYFNGLLAILPWFVLFVSSTLSVHLQQHK
jgi:hypothetical protein